MPIRGGRWSVACFFIVPWIIIVYFIASYYRDVLPEPDNMIVFFSLMIFVGVLGPPIILGVLGIGLSKKLSKKQKKEEEQIKFFICPQCNISVEKDPGICPKCGKNLLYGSDIVAK